MASKPLLVAPEFLAQFVLTTTLLQRCLLAGVKLPTVFRPESFLIELLLAFELTL